LPRRNPSYWKTTFGRWVSDYGVRALVKDLHAAGEPIHPATVHCWLSGRVYVRTSIALKLVYLSSGRISIQQIYDHRKELKVVSGPFAIPSRIEPGRT
jgi:hypothetical protein